MGKAVSNEHKVYKEMYNNFKSLYPQLSKKAIGYHPHGYFSITVWFEDGEKMIYDDTKKQGRWIH